MKSVLISGASGFVGQALVPYLLSSGYQVTQLIRPESKTTGLPYINWDPSKGILDPQKIEGFYAVIQLSGENIASSRWTVSKKQKIRQSRLQTCQLLVNTFSKLNQPPKVFICSSAVGFYADRQAEELDERSPVGVGFLAELAQELENISRQAENFNIRTVQLRIAAVLGKSINADGSRNKAGMLAKMRLPFLLGLGGKLGNGKQYLSWIHMQDLLACIKFILEHSEISGPVNAVSPNPVSNAEFTKAFAASLNRPAVFPVPGFILKLIFGELAGEVLLASNRAVPKKLLELGFSFEYPEINIACESCERGG